MPKPPNLTALHRKHRDPQYVKDQLEKRAEKRRAAEPPGEIALAEPTEAVAETASVPTLEDSLSAEARAEVDKFMQAFGDTVEVTESTPTPSPEEVAINGALADEKAKLAAKAAKAPKEPRVPGEPKVAARTLEGHCRVCGKSLSNEKSVTRGIGPVCYAAMLREYKWNEAEAREHVEHDTDEEWTALVQQIRELLYHGESEITDVPEGYVSSSKFWRACEARGFTSTDISRATGGNRNRNEPIAPEFKSLYVQVGNAQRKFLPPECMTEEAFAKIAAARKAPTLNGAAKAAREKAAAEKLAGKQDAKAAKELAKTEAASKKAASVEGNEAVAMADGSFS